MIARLLIANRGEIACRVIATARRMGLATIAVYSDADAEAKHVAMADEAVRIGPAPAAQSYLDGEAVIAAARRTGAQAIHPGYGFLSENGGFAEAVAAAGLIFVGPPPQAIRAMGLKDAAKALMEKAGAPVVPGYHGAEQDPAFLKGRADEIGWPVMIKARAGGGGKGMRRVERPEDFAAALESARREAGSSFGDPACLIEKAIPCPRHLEIQILADAHGAVLHLFERDCSLQRRHQKVIEEAPAPDMPASVRDAMGRAAIAAARAIGYRGAGTVEFIADGSGPLRPDGFWFMEMNTRLQVEHPVTEAITGLDLVEWQLRVAAGEALPFTQDDLSIDGHAVEARLYAEDPARGFLPAAGTLTHLRTPPAAAFAPAPERIDSGVRAGDAITTHYDPMLAKLIVHAPNRRAAFARLSAALAQIETAGVTTNQAFLAALARHGDVLEGRVDTGLIGRGLAALIAEPDPPELVHAAAALAAAGLLRPPAGDDPWDRLTGWRHWGAAAHAIALEHRGARIERRAAPLADGTFRIEGGDAPLTLRATPAEEDGGFRLTSEGLTLRLRIAEAPGRVSVFHDGAAFHYAAPDPLADDPDADAGEDALRAPMPGVIRQVTAVPGAALRKGDPLLVLEAMKMEHRLTAPRDGVLAEICVAEGDQVEDGATLARLGPEDPPPEAKDAP